MSENEEYRPRPNDHLVEPFYEGLEGAAEKGGQPPPRPSWLERLRRLLRRLLGRPDPQDEGR